eukprot:3750725-Prymnesium_polylepis.2
MTHSRLTTARDSLKPYPEHLVRSLDPTPIGGLYGCRARCVQSDGGRDNHCPPPASCEPRSPESFSSDGQATAR